MHCSPVIGGSGHPGTSLQRLSGVHTTKFKITRKGLEKLTTLGDILRIMNYTIQKVSMYKATKLCAQLNMIVVP